MQSLSHISEIIPRLFVGNVTIANNYNELKKRGITHIFTVAETAPPFPEVLRACLIFFVKKY
jgi:hypothetical protein